MCVLQNTLSNNYKFNLRQFYLNKKVSYNFIIRLRMNIELIFHSISNVIQYSKLFFSRHFKYFF